MSKRDKMWGQPVSKEEMLKALGHPIGWARNERKVELRNRLKSGSKELDIFGIQGCPGHPGYLDYLKASLENPSGSNTGLVSEDENRVIKATVIEEVILEIKKYEELLVNLLKSPQEVSQYIAELHQWINLFEHGIDPNPESQPIEELVELSKLGNEKAQKNIEETKKEIDKYFELLHKLVS